MLICGPRPVIINGKRGADDGGIVPEGTLSVAGDVFATQWSQIAGSLGIQYNIWSGCPSGASLSFLSFQKTYKYPFCGECERTLGFFHSPGVAHETEVPLCANYQQIEIGDRELPTQ